MSKRGQKQITSRYLRYNANSCAGPQTFCPSSFLRNRWRKRCYA